MAVSTLRHQSHENEHPNGPRFSGLEIGTRQDRVDPPLAHRRADPGAAGAVFAAGVYVKTATGCAPFAIAGTMEKTATGD